MRANANAEIREPRRGDRLLHKHDNIGGHRLLYGAATAPSVNANLAFIWVDLTQTQFAHKHLQALERQWRSQELVRRLDIQTIIANISKLNHNRFDIVSTSSACKLWKDFRKFGIVEFG